MPENCLSEKEVERLLVSGEYDRVIHECETFFGLNFSTQVGVADSKLLAMDIAATDVMEQDCAELKEINYLGLYIQAFFEYSNSSDDGLYYIGAICRGRKIPFSIGLLYIRTLVSHGETSVARDLCQQLLAECAAESLLNYLAVAEILWFHLSDKVPVAVKDLIVSDTVVPENMKQTYLDALDSEEAQRSVATASKIEESKAEKDKMPPKSTSTPFLVGTGVAATAGTAVFMYYLFRKRSANKATIRQTLAAIKETTLSLMFDK